MAHPSRSSRLAMPILRSHSIPTRSPSSVPQSLLAPFSTTARAPLPLTPKGSNLYPAKGDKRSFRNVRKRGHVFEKRYRPAPGDRRTLRKRVVLSNVNALDVELEDLNTNTALDASKQGQIVGLPGPLVDRLRALHAFKSKQSWGWFKRPSFLIRPETAKVAHMLEAAAGTEATPRWIFTGELASGKSVLLLQAQAMALLKDWVVISIPEGQELTIGHTGYAPIPNTDPPLYSQDKYASELLLSIANANPILQTLKIQDPKSRALPHAGSLKNLQELCLSARTDIRSDFEVEPWAVFEALWAELTHPGQPPVLLALDGVSQFMQDTVYRAPDFEPIHAHDFALIRWFVEHLSGARQLPNGGAVLAATCASCAPDNPTFASRLQQLKIEQALAAGTMVHDPAADPMAAFLEATGQKSQPIPPMDPHVRWDQRVLDTLSGSVTPHATKGAALPAKSASESASSSSTSKEEPSEDSRSLAKVASPPYLLKCEGLDRAGARTLMEYWARSGMLRVPVTGSLVAQQWTAAGGGVIGELERACLKTRI